MDAELKELGFKEGMIHPKIQTWWLKNYPTATLFMHLGRIDQAASTFHLYKGIVEDDVDEIDPTIAAIMDRWMKIAMGSSYNESLQPHIDIILKDLFNEDDYFNQLVRNGFLYSPREIYWSEDGSPRLIQYDIELFQKLVIAGWKSTKEHMALQKGIENR